MAPLHLALILIEPDGHAAVVSGRAWQERGRLAFRPDGAGATYLLPAGAEHDATPVPPYLRSLVGGARAVLALPVQAAERRPLPIPSSDTGHP